MLSTTSILIKVSLVSLYCCWCCSIPGTVASPLLRNYRRRQQQSSNDVLEVILPLGDSITSNGFGYFSYRYYLWRLLVLFSDQNSNTNSSFTSFDFDFVGTLENNYNGNPEWPPVNGQQFDRDHEGHWGWRADQIVNELAGWLKDDSLYEHVPTIALIHLGTNDCFQGQSVDSTLAELEEIAEILWSYNANMKLFYAKIIPSTRPVVQDCLDAINTGLDDLQSKYNNINGKIILVDMAEGFDPVTDTWDGTHPNNNASEIMAQKWFDAIMLQLMDGNNNTISPSMAPTTMVPTQSSGQQDSQGSCCKFWRWICNVCKFVGGMTRGDWAPY